VYDQDETDEPERADDEPLEPPGAVMAEPTEAASTTAGPASEPADAAPAAAAATDAEPASELRGAVMTVVETEVVEIGVDGIEDAELVDDESPAEPVEPVEPVVDEDAEPELDEVEARVDAPEERARPRIPIPRPGLSDAPILDPETLPTDANSEVAVFELPCVIAIANQKGGVGKTTTAVNLGAALAELDFRVLVVDLDPQGNATTGLGINPRDVETSVYDALLNDVALEDVIEPTTLRNLFVAPATIDLAGAEIELVPAMSRELRLKRAIDAVRPDYDLVLIDCPPSLGLLTVNGLAAADDVIVPIQCEYYALEGLGQLLRNVGLVQSNLNQDLDVRGIILTMYDARTKLADQVESEVRNYFGPKVYRTVVPRTVRLSEAPSFGQPIIVFDPTSRGASAYRELAKEVSRGASKRSR
jgi:chromosome partitioning protein